MINSESRLTSFPSFRVQPSEVALLFDSNLSRCPFLLIPRTGRPRQFHQNFHFTWKNKVSFSCLKFTTWQSIKILLTLELSQYCKSGRMFSSSEPVAASSYCSRVCTDFETPCVCARLSNPPKQSRRAAPRAWPLILPSKPSITFLNSLRRDCQMTGRLKLGLKLEFCLLTNELKRFYHLQNHSINCTEFEFFLNQLLMLNLSQAKQVF